MSGTELASKESGASLVSRVCEPAADADVYKYTCIEVHCVYIYFRGSEVKGDVIGSFCRCEGIGKGFFAKMLMPWQSSQEWVEIPQADKGGDHWRQKQQGPSRDNTNPQGRTECREKLTFAKLGSLRSPFHGLAGSSRQSVT